MKAITLWQPWASLLGCGAKKYETRSWATSYRGPIAIHAAKKEFNTDVYLDRELQWLADGLNLPDIYSFNILPLGCVIATAQLVACHEIVKDNFGNFYAGKQTNQIGEINNYGKRVDDKEVFLGNWEPGHYAWEFTDMKLLDQPIIYKGKQRLWNFYDELKEN